MNSSTSLPLPMIEEEDEPRASTSRSSSPNKGTSRSSSIHIRSKRRYANLNPSDICLPKIPCVHENIDSALHNADLSSSRFLPHPPATPTRDSTPDPFSLDFPGGALKFPHPPISVPSPLSFHGYRACSQSPTPSLSSSSSASPATSSTGLPTTPTSSDDEFPSYYYSPTPAVKPRRITIKPLVINKHNPPVAQPECIPPPSGPSLPSTFFDDTECESDSEWYSREFSQVLTLCSPTPSNASLRVRPDSVCITENLTSESSLVSALSPSREGFTSAELDPFLSPRRSSRFSAPNYPPPPIPNSPKCAAFPSPTKASRPRSRFHPVTPSPQRPPPRSSIPADCVLVDDNFTFSDDAASAFSLSLYDDAPLSSTRTDSPQSVRSEQSFQLPRPHASPSTPHSAFPTSVEDEFDFEDIQFDVEVERPMILPLDIPTSPLDIEADLASRFEQLRNEPHPQAFRISDAPSFKASPAPRCSGTKNNSRELRSHWSSSSFDDHSKRGGLGPALRSYFGSASMKSKLRSSPIKRSGSGSSEIPKRSPSPTPPGRLSRQARRESDVMLIGYGYSRGSEGLGRSLSPTVGDAGSD
ncbi:hypothetical protein H0H92_006251 [Tricholoma furcatifolium]|nr:hypothetical protein H0H92_006251 [Tricholoma furcatifolium]